MREWCGAMLVLLGLVVPGVASAQSSPSPFTYATRYDAMRRVTGTIAPDPDGAGPLKFAAVRNSYDLAGRLTKVETGELASWQSEMVAPSAWTGFTLFRQVDTVYDSMSRKARETVSAGGTAFALTQYGYDNMGRLDCTAVRMNPAVYASLPASACTLGTAGAQGPDRITKNVYDAAGQVTKVQRAYATPLQQDYAAYSYTPNGKQASVTDAGGNKAAMTWDGFDRQARWNFPSKTTPGTVSTTDYEEYGYDAGDNRLSLRKRSGQVIGYSYDALNRVSVKDIPGGTAADVYYGYDLRGLQTHARFGSSAGQGVSTQYDGFGRVASSTTNQGGTVRTLSHLYDADGNRVRITYPNAGFSTYEYDGLDRMTVIRENGAILIASYSYDAQGRRAALAHGCCAQTAYAYDGVSRLASLTHDLASTANDVTSTFAYNPASQIVTRTRSNPLYAYAAPAAVSQAYTANGLNQYSVVGGTAYTYDANGNLTGDGSTTYTYDVENRLISASGAKTATLVYDPLGRLYQTSGGAPGTVRYLYDGDALVGEYDGAGASLRGYVHGPGVDEPVFLYDAGNGRYLYADHQGSIVAVTDAGGAALAINRYDPWGVPAATNAGRFQYTGQIMLPELGMYHYKARIYDPGKGRFLQTDPVGYEDQVNLYAYVANDPVNMRDPAGKTGYYVSRAAGGTGGAADHGFVVVADYPGGPIKGIYSYTDIDGTLRSSANDISRDSTLRTDVSVWNSLDTKVADEIGATFNIIDATDASIHQAGNAVDDSLQSGEVGYSAAPALTPSGCNSNCGAAAVANIATRVTNGDSRDHPAPDNSRWAPGREQSDRIEERIEPR